MIINNLRRVSLPVILLALILLGGLFLRLYKLDQIPPSLSWDEAANGYNAWAVGTTGMDEWGHAWPLTFTSFGDDKHPVLVYATLPFVALIGLNEVTTRLPSVLFGTANILLLFLVSRFFFSKGVGLIAATILAVSPYSIQFSRFSHELQATQFFFLLGLVFFLYGTHKRQYLVIASFVSFGISLFAYHSAKIVVPPLVGLLILLYIKKLWQMKFALIISLIICVFFAIVLMTHPKLLGTARFEQTNFKPEELATSQLYTKTRSELLGRLEIGMRKYPIHFSKEYLFLTGDKNPRHSTQHVGEFYPLEGIFMVFGLLWLVYKRSKASLFLITWIVLAPLPSTFSAEAPHASRAMFMVGSMHLLIALGIDCLLRMVKGIGGIRGVGVVGVGIIVAIVFFVWPYLHYYFTDYAKDYAIEWQYGMKQAVLESKNDKYSQVFMTEQRSQPYIFYLYYTKTSPQILLETVEYTRDISKTYNQVDFFDKYYFGGWDFVESFPHSGVLYVVTESQYSGLRHREAFQNTQVIRFPNGNPALYMVSLN
jgi:4-amino-4-deoxy-L-arabinose transferase-like glycosyltransferase